MPPSCFGPRSREEEQTEEGDRQAGVAADSHPHPSSPGTVKRVKDKWEESVSVQVVEAFELTLKKPGVFG